MSRTRNYILTLYKTVRFSRRGTVRKMFSFSILGFVLLLGAAVVTSKDVSYVRLETNAALVEAGQRFSIDIFAFAHVPVNAVDITLTFEESSVEVISIDRGQSVLTIWTEDPIIEKGKVILRGGTFRKGFVGEHRIATVELRAKKTGQSEFFASQVILLAGDGQGTPVATADSTNSKVSLFAYDENTDPANIGVDVAVTIVTDIDDDGKVSLKDVSAFMAGWATKRNLYDFNGDGQMTFRDFSIILADVFFGV